MSQFSGYKCDGCGQVRGESNRWFVGFAEEISSGPSIRLMHFDDGTASLPEAIHLCGETCALKRVSVWLADQQPKLVEKEETL